jgi:hypothetical protein
MPAGVSWRVIRLNSLVNAAFDLVNIMAKSNGVLPFPSLQAPSAALSSSCTSVGASVKDTQNPGLIPSFFGSGVPEYPGIDF